MSRLRVLFLIALILKSNFVAPAQKTYNLDAGLTELIGYIESAQLQRAIEQSESMLVNYPGSNAVQLIYADLRNMLAHGHVSMAATENYSKQLLNTLNELRARLRHRLNEPSKQQIPDNFLKIGPQTQHLIAVDMSRSRLYLFEKNTNANLFLLREHHYVSIGLGGSGKRNEGDLRTPIGIYNIDGFKPDSKLPKLYGSGAFTLDYPNVLDRLSGRTGSGIWLHGMPHDQLSRPPQDSEGCVVLQNELIQHLRALINPSTTPVLLSQALRWHQTQVPHTRPLLSDLLRTLARQYPETDKIELEEVFMLPGGSPGTETGDIYRVRFLLMNNSQAVPSLQRLTQYWRKNPADDWSFISEEV